MPNWVRERADGVRLAEKQRKEEFERKTAATAELKGQLAPFWKALIGELQEAVKDFIREFPETDRLIDQFETPAADAFSIRRTSKENRCRVPKGQ